MGMLEWSLETAHPRSAGLLRCLRLRTDDRNRLSTPRYNGSGLNPKGIPFSFEVDLVAGKYSIA